MNTGAFASFLRHLLFFLVLMKMINGIIIIYSVYDCFDDFDEHELLPLNLKAPRHSVYLAIREMQLTAFGTGIGIIMISLMGLIGAIHLNTYPLINFTVGLDCIFLMTGELGCAAFLEKMLGSLSTVVVGPVRVAFNASNSITGLDGAQELAELSQTWEMPLGEDGWCPLARGTDEDHAVVDFIQTTMQCCGLTGRTFWKLRLPASCCDPNKYSHHECMFSTAYSLSCLHYFRVFRSCVSGMMMECVFFALLSLATAFCCLHLARLNVLYPTQDYGSDSSSDSEDEVEVY